MKLSEVPAWLKRKPTLTLLFVGEITHPWHKWCNNLIQTAIYGNLPVHGKCIFCLFFMWYFPPTYRIYATPLREGLSFFRVSTYKSAPFIETKTGTTPIRFGLAGTFQKLQRSSTLFVHLLLHKIKMHMHKFK